MQVAGWRMMNRDCWIEGGRRIVHPGFWVIADKWSGMELGCWIDFGLSRQGQSFTSVVFYST